MRTFRTDEQSAVGERMEAVSACPFYPGDLLPVAPDVCVEDSLTAVDERPRRVACGHEVGHVTPPERDRARLDVADAVARRGKDHDCLQVDGIRDGPRRDKTESL